MWYQQFIGAYPSLKYLLDSVHFKALVVKRVEVQRICFAKTIIFIGLGGGGTGVSESMDRRRCAILALEVVPKNLIST